MDVTYVQRNVKPAVAKAVAANFWELLAIGVSASCEAYLLCCWAAVRLSVYFVIDKEGLGSRVPCLLSPHSYTGID